jgi:hypothetical protein
LSGNKKVEQAVAYFSSIDSQEEKCGVYKLLELDNNLFATSLNSHDKIEYEIYIHTRSCIKFATEV